MFFITKFAEQNNGEFNTVGKNREIGECEGGIVVCDVILVYNQKSIYPFFTRGCYKDLHAQYSSQQFSRPIKKNNTTIKKYRNLTDLPKER